MAVINPGSLEAGDLQGELPGLTDAQRVLAFAGLHRDTNAVTAYTVDEQGFRVQPNAIREDEKSRFYSAFAADPKVVQGYVRVNLMAMMGDEKIPDIAEREERFRRYVDEYLDLIIKADHVNFRADPDKVYNGVPVYVMDGLSDMGKDSSPDQRLRMLSGREKIRVDKRKIFDQCRPLFYEIFSRNLSKKEIVEKVAMYVYEKIRYDEGPADRARGDTIGLHEFMKEEAGVCRHHALYTQVVLQALGITSRLFKCELDFGSHACNLVRIDNFWHLLDVTNPFKKNVPNGNGRVDRVEPYLVQLPESDQVKFYSDSPDLNGVKYVWNLPPSSPGKVSRHYESHSNMFFRVMKN